jgi:prepilin-type N-terminal cleavage/methylation domain-containing protein
MFRPQSGFSLIELVVSLSIMAVLMTLAMTSYSSYSQRAGVSTGLALTSPIKLAVQEYFMKNNRFPLTNEAAGLFPADQYTDTHVRSISINETPSPGTITIAYKGAGAISEGDSLLLMPSGDASGIRWKCTSFTLLGSLLPASCR